MLIVHAVPGQESQVCKLVPELVQFTGLTEGMRRNKAIWREVATIAKVDAPVAIKKAQEFIRLVQDAKNLVGSGPESLFEIDTVPRKLKGKRLKPGYIVMGEREES